MTERHPSYGDLLARFQPRPIGSKAALEKSYRLIEAMMNKASLSRAESEILELLSMLVEQYESRDYATPVVSPSEMLEHLIESRGISNSAAAAEMNIPRSILSDILAGRRRISLSNVRKFADYFRVPPSVFVSKRP